MTATLTLQLDAFGDEALGRYARQSGRSLAHVIRLAIRYYLADRDSEAPGWHAPRFARDEDDEPGSISVAVKLDDAVSQALEAEARSQDIDAVRLAEHACLYFLGDLDSGRLGTRLAESPGLRT